MRCHRAAWLPIKPGDRVLDLCAAPGGKSTELAAKLAGTGVLFSNDISNSRAKALLKNLEMFGAGNICVTSEAPEKMAGILPEFLIRFWSMRRAPAKVCSAAIRRW